MNEVFEGSTGLYLKRAGAAALVLLALFLALKSVSELRGMRYIGAGVPAVNTITVEGDGETVAIPDIGEFTFSVVEKASTVAAAQDSAAKKLNAAIAYLKGQGVDEKDVKTVNYSVGPVYEWQQTACAMGTPCPGGKSVLTGYEVRQSVSVKVRDTKRAGELLTGVGSTGATELSGLTFTVDNDDELQASAREEAIGKAKEKAEVLASQLGVKLVRIVNFNENGGGYPTPMYSRDGYGMGGVMATESKVAPSIPTGENKITSHVTITYEIR
jgi:uncharacterized protein YggE